MHKYAEIYEASKAGKQQGRKVLDSKMHQVAVPAKGAPSEQIDLLDMFQVGALTELTASGAPGTRVIIDSNEFSLSELWKNVSALQSKGVRPRVTFSSDRPQRSTVFLKGVGRRNGGR